MRSWEGHCASIRVHCGVTSLTRYLTSLCLGFLVCKMGTVIPAPLTCGAVELNEIKGVNCLGVFSFFILCAPKPQWEHQEELGFFPISNLLGVNRGDKAQTGLSSMSTTVGARGPSYTVHSWGPEPWVAIPGPCARVCVCVCVCVCVRNAKTMGPVSQSPAIGPVAENLPIQSHPSQPIEHVRFWCQWLERNGGRHEVGRLRAVTPASQPLWLEMRVQGLPAVHGSGRKMLAGRLVTLPG